MPCFGVDADLCTEEAVYMEMFQTIWSKVEYEETHWFDMVDCDLGKKKKVNANVGPTHKQVTVSLYHY